MVTRSSYPDSGYPYTLDSEESIEFYRAEPGDEPRLSLNWMQHRKADGNTIWGLFRQQADEADRYYNVAYDIDVPDGATKLLLPTFQVSVDKAKARLQSGYIDINVPIRNIGQEQVAEKNERFLHNAVTTLEQLYPVKSRLIAGIIKYGVIGLQLSIDTDQWWHLPRYEQGVDETDSQFTARVRAAWEELEKRRSTQFPFKWSLIDPRNLIWDLQSETPRWVMATKKVDARYLKANNPTWRTSNSYVAGEVEVTEVWTKTQYAMMAEDVWVVEPRRHTYGMIPVVIFDAQLSGTIYPRNPDVLYRGAGFGKYQLIEAQSKMMSTLLDIMRRSAYPPLLFKGGSEFQARIAMRHYRRGPSAHVHIPEGMNVEAAPTPNVPTGLFDAISTISELIASSIYTSIASQSLGLDAASGYRTALQQGDSSLDLTPTERGIEHGFQRICEWLLRSVENVIGMSVNVYGNDARGREIASIRPADINGRYSTSIKLMANTPNEQERLINLWSTAIGAGIVDHGTGLRNMEQPNVSDILQKLDMEGLRRHPIVQEAMAQWYLLNRLPAVAQAYETLGDPQAGNAAQEAARNIILSQGAGQLPNSGQFGLGNQAGINPANPGSGVPGTVEPVLPNTLEDVDRTARQIQLNPGGQRTTAGNRLPPGIRL